MRSAKSLAVGRVWFVIAAVVIAYLSTCEPEAAAQGTQGQNAVCTSPTQCSTTVGTSAFIDASVFATSTDTFCSTIYKILNPSSYSPSVIDARGFPGSSGASMTCASGTTPWNNGATFLNKPSTILLPAGTIAIPTGWVLPSNTHLFGQGDNIYPIPTPPVSNLNSGTVIQACTSSTCSSGFSGTAMIQFGNSSGSAAVAVEKLILDGQGQTINGIVNQYSQSNSYADHVGLYQILGTGLLIKATGSGPYTNITFDIGKIATANSSTVCAQIYETTWTAGIRGLTCTSELAKAQAAVLLDASSNSLKDVNIAGFYDGILVGSNAPATSNVLINVIGDTTTCQNCVSPIYVVDISTIYKVTDLTIIGVSNQGGQGTFTILDNVTSALLGDAVVGIYALGKNANNVESSEAEGRRVDGNGAAQLRGHRERKAVRRRWST